nr:hypothetical protein [Tanacetum cinerariifolium]
SSLVDPVIQCLVNFLQRPITQLVYLIEAHHHLNPISIPKRNGPWRIDDCVVMLVLEACGIPLRVGEVQLSLRAITELVYLIEAHHHLNPISIPKRDSPWRIDDCVVMLVFKARGIPLSSKNLLVFRWEVVQVTLKMCVDQCRIIVFGTTSERYHTLQQYHICTPLQSKTDLVPFALSQHQDSMPPSSLRWTVQLGACGILPFDIENELHQDERLSRFQMQGLLGLKEEEVANEVETQVAFLVTRDSFSSSYVLQPSLVRVPQSDHGSLTFLELHRAACDLHEIYTIDSTLVSAFALSLSASKGLSLKNRSPKLISLLGCCKEDRVPDELAVDCKGPEEVGVLQQVHRNLVDWIAL